MIKLFEKKSKRGITLVESAIAVVLLGFVATGVLTMLTASGTKIFQLSDKSAAYAEATQQMDLVISVLSNSKPDSNHPYILQGTGNVDTVELKSALGLDGSTRLVVSPSVYPEGEGKALTSTLIRGWYLTLEYQNVTVKAFASNSKGEFDGIPAKGGQDS